MTPLIPGFARIDFAISTIGQSPSVIQIFRDLATFATCYCDQNHSVPFDLSTPYRTVCRDAFDIGTDMGQDHRSRHRARAREQA